MGLTHKNAAQTRQGRIDWLLAHQDMWYGWLNHDPRTRRVVEAMRRDGVVSKTTYWKDVNIPNLVIDARTQKRTGTKWCDRPHGKKNVGGRARGCMVGRPDHLRR
jgi:hypothetical protein